MGNPGVFLDLTLKISMGNLRCRAIKRWTTAIHRARIKWAIQNNLNHSNVRNEVDEAESDHDGSNKGQPQNLYRENSYMNGTRIKCNIIEAKTMEYVHNNT